MDLTGTITVVMPAQSGTSSRTGNPWMSQEYVMEIPGQWPRHNVFRIFGEDRIRQFNLQQGEQNVTIQFDIDAHEYNGRWFNEVRCYNVLRSVGQQPYQQQPPSGYAPNAASSQTGCAPFPPQVNSNGQPMQGQGSADDLPF